MVYADFTDHSFLQMANPPSSCPSSPDSGLGENSNIEQIVKRLEIHPDDQIILREMAGLLEEDDLDILDGDLLGRLATVLVIAFDGSEPGGRKAALGSLVQLSIQLGDRKMETWLSPLPSHRKRLLSLYVNRARVK